MLTQKVPIECERGQLRTERGRSADGAAQFFHEEPIKLSAPTEWTSKFGTFKGRLRGWGWCASIRSLKDGPGIFVTFALAPLRGPR
jgi:hypothetical protein